MSEDYMKFEFNYASFFLNPYSGGNSTSSYLLKSIIKKINEEDFPSDKRIIDRHKNQKNSTKRKIVLISNQFGEAGLRCFGRIALIKNKAPLLWSGKDIIEEIEKEENKQFIEITNYTIHFNEGADPVIMHEFNSEGPRLSDIEFYLRQIATEFRIAKSIKTILHLKTDYEQLDKEMRNIFTVKVKVNSGLTNRYEWLKTLQNLNDDSGYKDVRLEFFFKRKKGKDGKYEKNIKGTDLARNIIGWIRKDSKNINYLGDLKMSYQVGDNDEIIDLDFLRNKVTSLVKAPLIDGKKIDAPNFKFNIGQEFNYYLKTGKTNSE